MHKFPEKFPSRAHRLALVIACVAGLGACSAPAPHSPLSTKAAAAPISAVPRTAVGADQAALLYRIVPAESALRILVYRGGTMAKLGHNHVISSADVHGRIWRGPSLESSGFEITVPVNTLIVDDNSTRLEEGEDFPLNLSEDAKAGTKANMLRPTLLDGAQYPDITIRSTQISGDGSTPEVVASMRIKDQTRDIRLPVRITDLDGGIAIQGSFEFRQSDFGITPLSIAMGALTVQDTVKIKFRLVAKATQASP
nr:YceI family protein [uncultured Rhodoferax sp.]